MPTLRVYVTLTTGRIHVLAVVTEANAEGHRTMRDVRSFSIDRVNPDVGSFILEKLENGVADNGWIYVVGECDGEGKRIAHDLAETLRFNHEWPALGVVQLNTHAVVRDQDPPPDADAQELARLEKSAAELRQKLAKKRPAPA